MKDNFSVPNVPRPAWLLLPVVLLTVVAVVLIGPMNTTANTADNTNPIQHVVILIKENHSFDNMFGTFPGADGTTDALEGAKTITMKETPDPPANDIGHDTYQALADMNHGKMNDFYKGEWAIRHGVDLADSQYHQDEIPDYWDYAQTFGLADHMFSFVLGDSYPNHLALVTGQNLGVVSDPLPIQKPPKLRWGCDSPSNSRVTISTKGHLTKKFPCFNSKTLADEANAANVLGSTTRRRAGTSGTSGPASTPSSEFEILTTGNQTLPPPISSTRMWPTGNCPRSPGWLPI